MVWLEAHTWVATWTTFCVAMLLLWEVTHG